MTKYIHYFVNDQNNISSFSKECLDSWKKLLPNEFEIKYWTIEDLENLDDDVAHKVSQLNNFSIKKLYLEIYAMYNYGGIYVDQNMKLICEIKDLLKESSSFLGIDEKHQIKPNIWYEEKAKSYLSTKIYNKFKESYEIGKYNNFFLDFSIMMKEILEDFDPMNKNTQRLKNDIILYGYDYFYPLSYNGHTKNKTSNTKVENYFHYDFITPKGKLKNTCYKILGYSLSKKIFAIFRLFKRIIRFFLKPILSYKKICKKNTEKHQNLVKLTLEKISERKNEYYIALHNPEFTGVSNSTIELFENSIPCGELISKKEIKQVKDAIKNNNIKEVIFSGFCIGWKELATSLHKNGIICKTYFHGSHSQYLDEYGWEMNKQIYLLNKKNIVKEMAFCKESIIDFYKDKKCNVSFLRNLVNLDYKLEKTRRNPNEFRVGVYAVQTTNWKKNVFSSLASVYFFKDKIKDKDKELIIDIVPKSESADAFCNMLGIKTDGVPTGIPRKELLERMSNSDVNLYVTFLECAPMLPLESFYVGVPCITGNNHHYFKNTELEKYLVVNNENNAYDIAEKINLSIKNKDKVLKLYKKFSEDNLKQGQKLVKEYLDVRSENNE